MRTQRTAGTGFVAGLLIGSGAVATCGYALAGAPWWIYFLGVLLTLVGVGVTASAEIRAQRERNR